MAKPHNSGIKISDFKTHCLRLLDETGKKGKEYTILKKGVPLARVVPVKKPKKIVRRGSLKGLATLEGDIVYVSFSEDWDVLK
ncbi:MAG: type II toxin-antitoxin system prevent-host-death family antitoxin [Deltaproteobacteria bacterium]|nr:type II toxin-antitoxin system prevent-host-death family antitoxin [Deltaproteobacteria bacterium]